mgnify:CR=1 FL=1
MPSYKIEFHDITFSMTDSVTVNFVNSYSNPPYVTVTPFDDVNLFISDKTTTSVIVKSSAPISTTAHVHVMRYE